MMKKHYRIWSKKVLEVIDNYYNNRSLFLFGITGDIDNLGVFVSRYGRPLAENLVDVYNHLIGIFMYEFVKNHPEEITSFCVIPSGEEIFATGAAVNKMVVENFFSLLKDDINNFIKENAYLMDENVTVSFGCKIFLRSKIDITMSHFVELVKEENIREASLMYLKLMYIMRYELAYELDKSKFSSLNASDLNLVIFFRNVVYNELQKYKSETREILINLTERLNNDTKFRERLESLSLNLKYGVKARNSQFISKIISGNKKAE